MKKLLAMGQQARDMMECEELTVLADRGYYNGDEVLACEGTGVLPCVPKTLTSGNTKRGLFTGQDFVYDAEHDHYTCPAAMPSKWGSMLATSRSPATVGATSRVVRERSRYPAVPQKP